VEKACFEPRTLGTKLSAVTTALHAQRTLTLNCLSLGALTLIENRLAVRVMVAQHRHSDPPPAFRRSEPESTLTLNQAAGDSHHDDS
jgi:hypothetical protein